MFFMNPCSYYSDRNQYGFSANMVKRYLGRISQTDQHLGNQSGKAPTTDLLRALNELPVYDSWAK
jgi:hypothetical protein